MTCQKHVICRENFGHIGKAPKVKCPPVLCTESGKKITTPGGNLITAEGHFNVYFGNEEALPIFLQKALDFFK